MTHFTANLFARGDRPQALFPAHSVAEAAPRPGSAAVPSDGHDFRDVVTQGASRAGGRPATASPGVEIDGDAAGSDPAKAMAKDVADGDPRDGAVAIADGGDADALEDPRPPIGAAATTPVSGRDYPPVREGLQASARPAPPATEGAPSVPAADIAGSAQPARMSAVGRAGALGADLLLPHPAPQTVPYSGIQASAPLATEGAPSVPAADIAGGAQPARMSVAGGTGALGADLLLPGSAPQTVPYGAQNETGAQPGRADDAELQRETVRPNGPRLGSGAQIRADAVAGAVRAGARPADAPILQGQVIPGGQDRAGGVPGMVPSQASAEATTAHARSAAEMRADDPPDTSTSPGTDKARGASGALHPPNGRAALAEPSKQMPFVAQGGLDPGASRPLAGGADRYPAEGTRDLAGIASARASGGTGPNELHTPSGRHGRISETNGAAVSGPPGTGKEDPLAEARPSLPSADPGAPAEFRAPSPAEAIQSARPGAAPVAHQFAGGDTARGAAWQIASAAQAGGERSFELSLNPAELGKVRITLTPGDSGMTVNIQADRPETLDLLRRHADMLGQDFRDMGYGGTSFTFEDGNQTPGNGGRDSVNRDMASTEMPADPGVPGKDRTHPATTAPGRMDIRL